VVADGHYRLPDGLLVGGPPSHRAGCWTPSRLELLSWLRRNALPLAELYEGAVVLTFAIATPGRFRFAAHAVREIGNRLPDAIAGPKRSAQVQYATKVEELAHLWRHEGLVLDSPTTGNAVTPVDPSIPIPRHLYTKISELIDEHLRGRGRSREAAERLFSALEDATVGSANAAVIDQWLDILRWFVGRSHNWNCLDSDQNEAEFRHKFELFESSLTALVRQFFSTVSELDEVLAKTNR